MPTFSQVHARHYNNPINKNVFHVITAITSKTGDYILDALHGLANCLRRFRKSTNKLK